MTEHRKDEYVYETLGELPVVEGADSGDETKYCSESGTGRTRRRHINRCRSVGCSRRNSALKSSREAILTINHAADIALATLAKRFSAGAAVRGCRLISVNGAS